MKEDFDERGGEKITLTTWFSRNIFTELLWSPSAEGQKITAEFKGIHTEQINIKPEALHGKYWEYLMQRCIQATHKQGKSKASA